MDRDFSICGVPEEAGPREGNGLTGIELRKEKRKKLDSLSGLVNNWSRTSRFLLFFPASGAIAGLYNKHAFENIYLLENHLGPIGKWTVINSRIEKISVIKKNSS